MRPPTFRRIWFSLATALALVGCGDNVGDLLKPGGSDGGGNGGGGNEQLTEDDIQVLLGLAAITPVTEFRKLQDFRSLDPIRYIALRDYLFTGTFAANGTCNPSRSNNTDANQNGIPDDAVLTYTAQNCSLTLNNLSGPVTGTIRVQDVPGSIFDLKLTYTNVRISFTQSDTTVFFGFDGSAEVKVGTNSATTINHITNSIGASAGSSSSTLQFAHSITTDFNPAGPINPNTGIPAGSFGVTGTMTVSAMGTGSLQPPVALTKGSYTVTISTPSRLTYNGICSYESYFFNGGQIRVQIQALNGADRTANWPNCGGTPPGKR
jgi:hypothetical protein